MTDAADPLGADTPPAGAPAPPPAGQPDPGSASASADMRPRPLIERIGMAAIALVLATMFGIVAVAAFAGGEPFLAAMGAIGMLMVLWVGALTLFRG